MNTYGGLLETCLFQPIEIELNLHSWKVGYCITEVFWEEFPSKEEAELRYRQICWSKVLLHPDRHVQSCSTAPLDCKGVGVAKLIASARLKRRRGEENPLNAIEKGEVPFVPAERLQVTQQALRVIWEGVAFRRSISWWSSASRLCYFDVEKYPGVHGHVALTIDDAPCRLGPQNCMVPQVRKLLRDYQAQASFMLIGGFVAGNEEELLSLLTDGHELGNHGLVDKSYASSSPEEFEAAIDECSKRITSLQRRAGMPEQVQWFRPPHGKLSPVMSEILERKGLTSVMCDTYACCPVIQDGDFIGKFLGEHAQDGSIIILHMPEHGFREWCLLGLETLLKRLKERGMKAVSLGHLAELAQQSKPMSSFKTSL